MSMMRKTKCQSKNPAECVDPKCPEKRYLNRLFDEAVKNNDFEKYFEAKKISGNLTPTQLNEPYEKDREYPMLVAKDEEGKVFYVPYTPPQQVFPYDTSTIPQFEDWEDMKLFFYKMENVTVHMSEVWIRNPEGTDEKAPGMFVEDLYVNTAIRGSGAGNWVMDIINKHADRTNTLLTLVPSSAGDGSLVREHKGYKQKALQHRERLLKFYGRKGYIVNPFWRPLKGEDEITKKAWVYTDEDKKPLYTRKAAKYLSDDGLGWLIRFPNQKPYTHWLSKRKTPAT